MRRSRRFVTTMVCGTLAGVVLLAADAAADVMFKGKRVDVIMGSAAGGGTDGTSRLIGRFFEKYLPGNPEMVYRNMPGGHGVKALNYFAANGKPDGTTWFGGTTAHVDANALKKPAVKYDPTKFHYIGGVSRGGSIVFIHSDKLKNLTDKSLPPVIVGELDGSGTKALMIMFGQEALGWNIKFVIGYPGTSQIQLAMRRNEVDMIGTSNLTMLKDMLKTGDYTGIAQTGDMVANGQVTGRSDFADIPVINDLVQGKLTGVAKEAFDFWGLLNLMDKWYALPPGSRADVVKAYQDAFDKAAKDPAFLKEAHVQFSEDFLPISGSFMQNVVAKTAYPAPEVTGFVEGMKMRNNLPAEPLSDEQLAALAKEKGLDKMPSVKAVLKSVGDGGRNVTFDVDGNEQSADVSSSRTQITLAGKKAGRTDLKAGLTCAVGYPGNNQTASAIDCQ